MQNNLLTNCRNTLLELPCCLTVINRYSYKSLKKTCDDDSLSSPQFSHFPEIIICVMKLKQIINILIVHPSISRRRDVRPHTKNLTDGDWGGEEPCWAFEGRSEKLCNRFVRVATWKSFENVLDKVSFNSLRRRPTRFLQPFRRELE